MMDGAIQDHLPFTADSNTKAASRLRVAIGGALELFISSPRLDKLLNAYTATMGLLNSCNGSSLENESNIRMISLFDNEEVGSQSAQGAGSSFQEYVLRRLCAGGSSTAFEESVAKSYIVRADQAHAIHSNYSDKHESNHQPGLHKGIVMKINGNQRNASTAITNTLLREIARIADVPLQDFVVRNDSPCGSTIGPIMSAKLGMATVDIGAPQLTMQSIRICAAPLVSCRLRNSIRVSLRIIPKYSTPSTSRCDIVSIIVILVYADVIFTQAQSDKVRDFMQENFVSSIMKVEATPLKID